MNDREQYENDLKIFDTLTTTDLQLFRDLMADHEHSGKGLFLNVQLQGNFKNLQKHEFVFQIGSYAYLSIDGIRYYRRNQRKF